MAFPGGGFGAGGMGAGQNAGMSDQEQQMVKWMQAGMESCVSKSILAGGAGFALGGAFGLFMSSMAYDTPLTSQSQAMSSLPWKQQVGRGLRDMGSKSYSSAKNFAMIGLLYSGTECGIESIRATNDLYNSVSAGCISGAILAHKAGPSAAALGCAGFAAFSTAIDAYMRMPESD